MSLVLTNENSVVVLRCSGVEYSSIKSCGRAGIMTRKEYVRIARAIKECVDIYKSPCPATIADNIANELKKDNPSFDKDRFLKACGVLETCDTK